LPVAPALLLYADRAKPFLIAVLQIQIDRDEFRAQ